MLTVDEAFRFGSYVEGSGIKMFWQVMPGYFLYRDKIEVLHDGKAQIIQLPQGVTRQDEIFGEVMVLDGLIELHTTFPPEQTLEVRYQGCAAQGFCYPPQEKSLTSAKMQINPKKW
ncbi:MAG: protein-disulfide reductase DsbD family protein [Pseudomonadales bacterium]|jgi:thiol:disulfide interchange protein DsbD|tara:strand:+ start:2387 stop:2734 length:348 start_codon:yes stop_codon:yes gene_type:complete